MKMNNKCRNTNIEILRLLLIVGICLWHILVHDFGLKAIGQEQQAVLPPPHVCRHSCVPYLLLQPIALCSFQGIMEYGLALVKQCR